MNLLKGRNAIFSPCNNISKADCSKNKIFFLLESEKPYISCKILKQIGWEPARRLATAEWEVINFVGPIKSPRFLCQGVAVIW